MNVFVVHIIILHHYVTREISKHIFYVFINNRKVVCVDYEDCKD